MLAPTPLSAAVDELVWSPHGHREEILEEFLANRGELCCGDDEDYEGPYDEDGQEMQFPSSPSRRRGSHLCAATLESLDSGLDLQSIDSGKEFNPASAQRPPRLRERRRPGAMDFVSSSPPHIGDGTEEERAPDTPSRGGDFCGGVRRPRSLNLATPSSSSSMSLRRLLTPGTPLPERSDLKLITGDVGAVFFDFDGTLTASPGDRAQRCRKQVELRERAPLLAPRLRALREAGIVLAIISKSSEATIVNALDGAGLRELFDGPLIAKAIGLEGKAGFIEEICRRGCLHHLGVEQRALLVDDDVRELERARAKGIQTFAAPKEGGLQDEDFDEMFAGLGIGGHQRPAPCGSSSGNLSGSSIGSSTLPPSPLAATGASLLQPSPSMFASSKSPVKRGLVPELPELPEFAIEEATAADAAAAAAGSQLEATDAPLV